MFEHVRRGHLWAVTSLSERTLWIIVAVPGFVSVRVGERVRFWYVLHQGGGNQGAPGRCGGPQAAGQQLLSRQGRWIILCSLNGCGTRAEGVAEAGLKASCLFCLGGGHLHSEGRRLDVHVPILPPGEEEWLHPRVGYLLQHRVHPLP